jgi:cytoskeletal protein CcmA (bactofilin family)
MNADINALLGAGSEFEGKLTFEGTVRIDGRFRGEIFSDGTLMVGEGAHIEAAIRVGTVIVYGEVVGDIIATNGVELRAPAALRGNITSPALHIDKGVFFDGSCQMSAGNEPAATAPEPQRLPLAPRHADLQSLPDRSPPAAARTKISGLYQGDSSLAADRGVDFKHEF